MDLKELMDGIKSDSDAFIDPEYAEQLQAAGEDTTTDTRKSAAEQNNRISESSENEASFETDSADVTSDASNEQDSKLSKDEDSTSDKPVEDSASEDTPEAQKALEGYAAKKIGKLTKKVHDANDELRELRQELERTRLQQSQIVDMPQMSVPMVNDFEFTDPQSQQKVHMPQARDFNGDAPAYMEARTQFEFAKKQALQFWQQAQKDYFENENLKSTYQQKLDAGKKQYKDFEEVILGGNLAVLEHAQPKLVPAIQKSPYAEHLVYHLAKNPELRADLAKQSPDDMLKTIGKMEGIIEMGMKPNVVSKAPPPISTKPSSGTGTIKSVSKDASKSQDEVNASIRERMRQGR
jgi:hypothetical protein